MPRSTRLRNERSHIAVTLRRRAPHAAVLTLALMLTPCLVSKARAADINTPVVSKGYVATDASEICTFWEGLGVETPFVLTDDYGRPVSWKNWIDTVNVETYDRFFNNLEGLMFLTSTTGLEWLRSPIARTWANSPTGRKWIDEFAKGVQPVEPVEYVRVCDAFGSGYFYIPGTETCLKLGGYIRNPDANPVTDFDSLRSGLQPVTSSAYSAQALQDLARAFRQFAGDPQSTPQQDANRPNPDWSGKLRVQRDFGSGSGDPTPTTQTPQQNGGASAGDGTTTPSNATSQAGQQNTNQLGSILSGKIQIPRGSGDMTQLPPQPGAFTANGTTSPGATTQAGTPSDGMITFRIFVKGHVSEGNPPGPPVPGQFVSLVGGNVEPDLPMSGATRTAEQENTGSDKGAPQGMSDKNGLATFRIDYTDVKNLMGNSYLRDALKLNANYTLNGTREVQKHGGFVAPAPDNKPAPNFTKGSLDGVSYRWNGFFVGTQIFWEGGYSVDYNVNVTADQVKEDIIATLRKELGSDVVVTFDGNVCRIELPARVTGPYTPVPQSLTAGIPEATIRLLAPRGDGGAP